MPMCAVIRSLAIFIAISLHTDIARADPPAVAIHESTDYIFGAYQGALPSPPSADGNPRRALIVEWPGRDYRFVFAHEGSYCPWFELADGSGACFQFFEGNEGWAELFNQFGRQEKNSFVEIVEQGPQRVHVRWTYFGVNQTAGERAYQATEDFYCLANGLVLRRQSYKSLLPDRHEGYAREPIELIGMCPVGKLWKDVLQLGPDAGEHHALVALDPFSSNRYDVYWKPIEGKLWESTPRHAGCPWQAIDDAPAVLLAIPMQAGAPFCAFAAASGYPVQTTRIKEHSHADTGGVGWISSSWDHWPIGWLNSQAHVVDSASLAKYPNHFSPAGMDLFAMSNEEAAQGEYWSLLGVAGDDVEAVRQLTRTWLELDAPRLKDPTEVEQLSTKLAATR